MARKTNKEFLKEVYNLVKEEYTFKEEYQKAKNKILVRHNECGYEYLVSPTNFLSGNRCPKCANNFKTDEMFKKEVYDLVKDEYSVLEEYKTKRHKISFKHKSCNTVFKQYPETFLIGRQCPKCGLERRSKENHYRYNPLLTQEEREKRDMFNGEIKKWREKVYKRDNYTCQSCNKKGYKINSHHIYSWDKYKEKRFDVDNGITLCEDCHKDFHKEFGYGNNDIEQFKKYMISKK